MIFLAYLFPIFFLLLALAAFHVEGARFVVGPSSVLILIWIAVLALHGSAIGLELVVLYPSTLAANMFVTVGVLAFSISFRVSKSLFGSRVARARPLRQPGAVQSSKCVRLSRNANFMREGVILLYALVVFYLMYTQAQSIIGSSDVFGQLRLLRTRINYEEVEWGLVEYAALSAVVAAVYLGAQSSGRSLRRSLLPAAVLAVAILIAAVSSQRTAVLMVIVGFFFARSASGLPSIRVIALSVVGFFGLFVLIGFLVGKVGNAESGASLVVQSGFQSFALYLLSPLSAFSSSEIWTSTIGESQFTTRFFYRVFESIGLYDGRIQNLVLDFSFVPIATNVYTFAHAPISDFGYGYIAYFSIVGVIYGYAFSFRRESPFVRTIQGLLYYPIVMSVFQDQWMTITSQWIQIIVSAWILHVLYNVRRRASSSQPDRANPNPAIP